MILSALSYPLSFSPDDRTLYPLDALAKHLRVSRAFVQLCVCLGCPTAGGGTSAAMVLLWLFDNFQAVREAAGMKPLAAIQDLPATVMARLRMADAVITLLEFSRTRATDWRQKRQLRLAEEQVSRLADHGA